MFGFSRKEKASAKLDLALASLLLGRRAVEDALRVRYREKWNGFVEDIAKGAKPENEALSLISIFILDVLGHDIAEVEMQEIVGTIYDKRTDGRPSVFDLIDQVAYYSWLFENSGDATKGITGAFFNSLGQFFSDDSQMQERVRTYFIESMLRYRENAHTAYKMANAPGGMKHVLHEITSPPKSQQ